MPTDPHTQRLNEWTARRIATATRAGTITCEAVTRACLARIEEREPAVEAWQHLDAEGAISQARALDRQPQKQGPLHGVPFGVKDIIEKRDMPTEYASHIYRGHRPGRDEACIAVIRRAGATDSTRAAGPRCRP